MSSDTTDAVGDDGEPDKISLKRLEECVVYLSGFLERPISAAAFRDAVPSTAEAPEAIRPVDMVRAAISAAEAAGLRSAFGKRKLRKIEPSILPAILLPEAGQPIVLHGQKRRAFVVHDPSLGAGMITQRRETLNAWCGGKAVHVLSFKPDMVEQDAETERHSDRHWFRSALGENRWTYVQAGIAAGLVNILALVVSIFTMVVYDRVLPSAATDSLYVMAVGVGIALLFDFIIKSLRAGFIDHAGQRADLSIGDRLFTHLIHMEMSERKPSVGQVAASMREMETLRDFFTSATMTALVDLPFVLMFLAVIYFLAGPLAIVPLIAVPLVLLIGFAIQPLLSRMSDKVLAEGQAKQTVLVETLTGIETIKAAGASRKMRARWAEAMQRQSTYAVRSRMLTQGAINATGFIQQSAQVGIIVFGALLVLQGEITSGVLIAAVILTGRALAPLGLISQTLTRYHQAQSAYRSLNALMAAQSERPAGKTWLSRKRLSGGIRFHEVRFSYPEQDRVALDGVSFSIAPGEAVAMMGTVGSGKSTIARLALGLYTPQSGVVRVDGIDIRQIDPAELRSNFGVVLQDNWLVSGTLRENIALGAFQPSDAQILRAARLSGVEHFASAHPDGYNMMLREGGAGLSGGQRQMVALARALVGDPPFLILDEPTAAMDAASEAAFIQNLKPLLKDRTLIVMTHRQSLLELVDRVIVLDRGTVKADGVRQAGGVRAS